MTSRSRLFELRFKPGIELVSMVRRFIQSFCEKLLPNPDEASRVALATHELLENAVRCAADDEARIRVLLEPVADTIPGRVAVRIETWNRTDPDNAQEVIKRLQALESATDRLAHYDALILTAGRRKDGSGLGLARVCVESEMNLRCDIEGDVVHVLAEAEVGP